jgi:hypothetical protein
MLPFAFLGVRQYPAADVLLVQSLHDDDDPSVAGIVQTNGADLLKPAKHRLTIGLGLNATDIMRIVDDHQIASDAQEGATDARCDAGSAGIGVEPKLVF